MGHPLWVEEPDQRCWRRRRPWARLFSRECCELRRPGSLDLTGDPSFPRSLRGSKPRPEPSKMGKCDGRCTLLVICSLQLVSVCVCVCVFLLTHHEDIIRGACYRPTHCNQTCLSGLFMQSHKEKALSCSCWGAMPHYRLGCVYKAEGYRVGGSLVSGSSMFIKRGLIAPYRKKKSSECKEQKCSSHHLVSTVEWKLDVCFPLK